MSPTPPAAPAAVGEEEIRPAAIFDEYLRLAEADARLYFADAPREPIGCPACGAAGARAFVKHGFAYDECPECLTLYVSPRPAADAFSRYYRESASVRYWATTFYRQTAEARREKLWKPKARMIGELVARFGSPAHAVVDVGGGYGIFAEEYERLTGRPVTVIEPGPALADVCRAKGLRVVERFLEDVAPADLPAGPIAFVSFELFEHLHDPRAFLTHLYGLMRPGDLLVFTTLSGTGVDIRALWDRSKSVSPPHHLNFFNPRSAQRLLEAVGFEVVEASTPGKLDIDILRNNQDDIQDRFWRAFVTQASAEERAVMQGFIAASGWSSHMWAVSRKP